MLSRFWLIFHFSRSLISFGSFRVSLLVVVVALVFVVAAATDLKKKILNDFVSLAFSRI
jgi:hypothetical protein